MTADDAHRLNVNELLRLQTSAAKHKPSKALRAMIREAQRTNGGLYEEDGGATWIWSDLHLHHANIIRYCARPFRDRDEMDEALLGAWQKEIAEGDTVINVGDVALARALDAERMTRLRGMPGRKLLVRGNHDFDKSGRASATGSDEAWMTLLIRGTPPLVLTHMPLEVVPAGAVNVHGHTHNNTPLRAGPYVNVCVEHTRYRPLRLDDVRRLGLARQRNPRPTAETTVEELEAETR